MLTAKPLTFATTTEERESGSLDALARVLAYRLVADRGVDLAIVSWKRTNTMNNDIMKNLSHIKLSVPQITRVSVRTLASEAIVIDAGAVVETRMVRALAVLLLAIYT